MNAFRAILPILAAAVVVQGMAVDLGARSPQEDTDSAASATTVSGATASATAGTPLTRDATPTVTGAYNDPTFISTVLASHNQYRALHGGAPVTWDVNKAVYAQTYADKCTFAHSGGPYGENLAIGGFSDPTDYIWMWYNERGDYDSYPDPDMDDFENWGHFTQVVWNATASIGCGFSETCTNLGDYGPYFLVCEYNTGNVLPASTFALNVREPSGPIPDSPPDMN